MRILQYNPEFDTDLIDVDSQASQFLYERGNNPEAIGQWASESQSLYDRYHSCYCAALGLVSYSFVDDIEKLANPPLPSILKFL